MRGQTLRELVQFLLQPLHVRVLRRLVEFLEVVHNPADNGRQLPAQNQKGRCRRLGQGFRLRQRRVCVVQVVLVQIDVRGGTGALAKKFGSLKEVASGSGEQKELAARRAARSSQNSQGISIRVRDTRRPPQDQRIKPVRMVEITPQSSPVFRLERVEAELGAVTMETNGLCRAQTRAQLGPALGQAPVVDLHEVHGRQKTGDDEFDGFRLQRCRNENASAG